MKVISRIFLSLTLILFVGLLLSGCAGSVKRMDVVSPDQIKTRPDSGKSMVVFMRPSGFAFGVQSSIFEVKDDQCVLIGIIAAKKKVSYQLGPGEHLFMVVGESADFMSAELEAGKTYYALVTPRMGAWKARFSLKPVHAGELDTAQFKEWQEGCEWVIKTADSDDWARKNMTSIQSKREKSYEKWMSKDASERPGLLAQDGE